MKKTGIFWHCHHDKLCEWVYDYDERVDYIKRDKPKNEIETRLRLFKKVKGKLPKEFVEAWKKRKEARKNWGEAWKNWGEAEKKRDEAWKNWDEAEKKRNEARKNWSEAEKKYQPEIEKLHAEECGCKEWNGEEMVFEGKENAKYR